MYVPFLQPFFDTVPLTLDDWLFMLPVLLRLADRDGSCSRSTSGNGRRAPRQSAVERSGLARGRRSCGSRDNSQEAMPCKVLIPVDGSRNCQFAVKHVIKRIHEQHGDGDSPAERPDAVQQGHRALCQQQEPARLPPRRGRKGAGADQQMLDGFGIPYSVHAEVGERAEPSPIPPAACAATRS